MASQSARTRAMRESPQVRNTMSNPSWVTFSEVMSIRWLVLWSTSHIDRLSLTAGAVRNGSEKAISARNSRAPSPVHILPSCLKSENRTRLPWSMPIRWVLIFHI